MRPTRFCTRSFTLLAVVAIAASLGACAPKNDPTGYTDVVKANFIQACTGNVDSPSTTLASTSYCECAYQQFVDNVPYNDDDKKNRDNGARFANYEGKTFVEVESELRKNPDGLPDPMRMRLTECGPGTGSTEPTATDAPAGTDTTTGTDVPAGTDAPVGTDAPAAP